MTNPTTPGTYRVTFRAISDSAELPGNLAWTTSEDLYWTGKEWLWPEGGESVELEGAFMVEPIEL